MKLRVRIVVAGSVALSLAAGCGGTMTSGGSAGPPSDGKVVYDSGVRFRVRGEFFEIGDAAGTAWRQLFLKGVNLGTATPGHLPGELAATKADYARWLQRIADVNANVVRLYTLHDPPFYEAFGEYNRAHPDRPLYLIQGVWLDELAGGDYITNSTAQIDEESAFVIDALHGNATIAPRYGKSYGVYTADVSSYLVAWLGGSEMDPWLVKASNDAYPGMRTYDGRFVSASDGLPIEAWVAGRLDRIVSRELDRYGTQRPVAWTSWPTLDPIQHPTEPVEEGQDLVQTDFARFTVGGGFQAGIFAAYHPYSYYPDFICYDPGYAATVDATGKRNSYLGYLRDLKAHHRGVPLLVAEFGVPTSLGIAHYNETSYNHGGYSEAQQAAILPDLLHTIVDAGAAGAIVFELFDEWFKQSWITVPTSIPWDRRRLWYDVIGPEESFGLLSYYPTAGSITIDGAVDDWSGRGQLLASQAARPVAPAGDGKDPQRTLLAVHAAVDPAFLFLRVDLAGTTAQQFDDVVLLVGLSTVGGATGSSRFPSPEVNVELPSGVGLEFAIELDTSRSVAELRTEQLYDPSGLLSDEADAGGYPWFNDNGQFVLSSISVNRDIYYLKEHLSFVPTVKRYVPGLLRRGNSVDDTLAHYQLGAGVLEVRLPWQALWVTDPSSLLVLSDDPNTRGFDAKATEGLEVFVVAAARTADGTLQVVDVLPRDGFANGVFGARPWPYLWSGWESVTAVERTKPAFRALADAYGAVR